MTVRTVVDKLSIPNGWVYRIHVRTDGKLTGSHVLERDTAIAKLVEYGHSQAIATDMIDNAEVPPERWSEFGR